MTDKNFPVWNRPVGRREFVRGTGALGLLAGVEALLPRYSWALDGSSVATTMPPRHTAAGVVEYDIVVDKTRFAVGGRSASAITLNGTVPGPLLRFREGDDVVLRVINRLSEDTSIHWHGLLVPPEMDGVPGVSFPGIRPRETFVYRFPIKQYGTYWYHSHSGLQEQLGHYGPLIIDPRGGYPYDFDREYVIVLSDWTFENPYKVLDRLKKQGNYYNNQRRTVGDFVKDVGKNGLMPTVRERLMWLQMRMDPTDLLDVTGSTYTYLMNGLAPGANWTGLFQPGERVLLRFINAGAGTAFDVRLPGLPMTVVQASGQFVQPVETDEFRIANAETFDVVIEPKNQPYTLFAESMERTGYAKGTLTPRAGWNAAVPPNRRREILSMADMGMAHGGMAGMDMGGMDMGAQPGAGDHAGMPGMGGTSGAPAPTPTPAPAPMDHSGMAGMENMAAPADSASVDRAKYAIAGMTRTEGLRPPGTLTGSLEHEPGSHGVDNAAVPMMTGSRLSEAGTGLGKDGWRVLRYTDLQSLEPHKIFRAPTREIEMHLTGNMERFMFSIDGIPFDRAEPVRVNFGERIRLTMLNDTMMNHPMHLHGMFMELENGHGNRIPLVHTVNVKPAERLSVLIEVDAPGRWAFHCHILYHMEVGMFRVFEVSQPGAPFDLGGGTHGK